MKSLRLITIGRKSGRQHEVELYFLPIAEAMLIVASYGGRSVNPDWYLNLVANPLVEVRVGKERISCSARTLEADERALRWPQVVEAFPLYASYQKKTEREIPLVLLEPRS